MAEKESSQTETQTGNNTVLIGRKPVMNYVVACLTFFNAGEEEVVVRCGRCGFSFVIKGDPLEVDEEGFFKEIKCPKCKVRSSVFGGEGDGDC